MPSGPLTSSYLADTIAMVLALLAVCSVAVVVLLGARRFGVGRAAGPIELFGRLALDARRAVYLVKVGEHVFLIGAGEGGLTRLGELPASEVPRVEAAPPVRFAQLLAAIARRKGQG